MLDKRWSTITSLLRVITDPQIHLLSLRFAPTQSHQVSLIESTCRIVWNFSILIIFDQAIFY